MTTPRDPDSILAAWLEEGPNQLPEPTRRAISVAIRTTRQTRRALAAPWRSLSMTPPFRIEIAVLTLAIGIGGTAYLLAPAGQVGGPPSTASPTPKPGPTAKPSVGDAPFVSERYGYSLTYPSGLTVQLSQRDWPPETVIETTSQFLDRFTGSLGGPDPERVFAGIASQPLPTGMAGDEWMTGHAGRNRRAFGDTCGGLPGDWLPTSVAGAAGRRARLDCGGGVGTVSEVVFASEGRGWVISGDTILVDKLVSTFRLPN